MFFLNRTFLLDPLIPTEIPQVANEQGSRDGGSIDGVNKTIHSKANIAEIRAGGWCTYKGVAAE
jgi:hypothetical protein